MKKTSVFLFLLVLPQIVFAQDSAAQALSFTPPTSDVSVIFLSTIFGVVDGVLAGTGSQIMGAMFTVFNSAVLALGGIIIMYTLMVSTMNTAHEGQLLGQKWSSIWVPVRSTLGLSLLIPKASGYCMMQIFVMWIIVQGVGAADKVWDAALNYLNQGGVIVKPSQASASSATGVFGTNLASDEIMGANVMLQGQVCMLGLEQILKNQRQTYLKQASKSSSGPCYAKQGQSLGSPWNNFCGQEVPSFTDTVNFVDVQSNDLTASSYKVNMPNFAGSNTSSIFSKLDGICGTVVFNRFNIGVTVDSKSGQSNQVGSKGLTSSDVKTTNSARGIAVQQMYVTLTPIASKIVNNNPTINPDADTDPTNDLIKGVAINQLGVPLNQNQIPCTSQSGCYYWGPEPSESSSTYILNGVDYLNAVNSYAGIMQAPLTLQNEIAMGKKADDAKAFIKTSEAQGWMLAGSYFYRLAMLNKIGSDASAVADLKSGLGASTFKITNLTQPFGSSGCNSLLCILFQTTGNAPNTITSLSNTIVGTGTYASSAPSSNAVVEISNQNFNAITKKQATGLAASTVTGYLNNVLFMSQPTQAGLSVPDATFAFPSVKPDIDTTPFTLPSVSFGCSGFMCIPSAVGAVGYWVLKVVWNAMATTITPFITNIIVSLIQTPLEGMSSTFTNALKIINTPGVNPIIALAQMGVKYINFSQDLWIQLMATSVSLGLIPIFGGIAKIVLTLVLPLYTTWLGVMVTIGFSTAYYVPFLPYIMFTMGAIGWLIAVIEAMVAAPIVALGVTHPEGEGLLGKGETALMIIMNVFLRPSMMIIGFITAIILSFVSTWVINAGFSNAAEVIKNSAAYTSWAQIYAFFFLIVLYTGMYITVVQKSFTLIALLPDKVLRWIGGGPESYGSDSQQWAGEVEQKFADKASEASKKGGQAIDKKAKGYATKAVGAVTSTAKSGINKLKNAGLQVG
jgi:defect in organelle trafficking protein DotA